MRSNLFCRTFLVLIVLSALCLMTHGELIDAADVMATCTSASAVVDTREEHDAYAALGGEGVEVVGDVDYTGDMTWSADKTWIVTGVVLVKGGTLTIEPGTKVLLGVGSGIRQDGGTVVSTDVAFEQLSAERVFALATAPGTEVDTREEHDAYAALGGEGVEVVGDVDYTGDMTWSADKTWIVTGVVLVKGGTLTIEPGTKVLLGVGSGIRQDGGTVVSTDVAFEQLSAEKVLALATAPGTEVDTREEYDAYAALGGEGFEVVGDVDYTDDVTWTADKTWIVTGVVLVKGGTLTIEPGTKVLLGVGSGIRQDGGTVVSTDVAFEQLSAEKVLALATAPGTEVDTRDEHDAYAALGGEGVEVVGDVDYLDDVTWTADKTWIVTGVVLVKGGTLTIEPGAKVLLGVASGIRQVGGTVVSTGVAFASMGNMDVHAVATGRTVIDTRTDDTHYVSAGTTVELYGEAPWTAPNEADLYTLSHTDEFGKWFARYCVVGSSVVVVSDDDITSDVTWTSNRTWIVAGTVLVKGGTLTIEPGTKVLLGVGGGIRQAGGEVVADGVAFSNINFDGRMDYAEAEKGEVRLDTDVGGLRVAAAEEPLAFSTMWGKSEATQVKVSYATAYSENADVVFETGPVEGEYLWQANAPGYYTFTHVAGDETLTAMFVVTDSEVTELVFDSTITESVDWSKDKVILVDGTVTVKSGATLTIAPGAVVKFMDGAGIVCEAGGRCVADGVIFTHVNDDTVGGDTLLDGSTSPMTDMYVLNGVSGNDTTQYRYYPDPTVTLSGTVAQNEVWRGFNVYHVTGNITVPNGVTLTVEPGAIIKFDSSLSLTVNSGATLNAIGTRAQPIVFTSIKDDDYGGDTNGDGNKTMPYLGDWTKICVNGGTANFDYTHILYSSRNETTGAINMPNGGKVVFNNGEIAHCAYDAVGVESGNFYMTNSVIRDCLLAFRHWAKDPIVNCIIYDCGRLTQGGGQNFVNCIFSHITETWEAFGFPRNTTYRNCCFWNEGGSVLTAEGTQDAMTVCGTDGNIWADPLFLAPDSGDFRLAETSPCVDAGLASVAPATDCFGQPRVNAPDIGICEVMPRNATSDIDLVPQSVTADAEAVSGKPITINWTVSNQGGADVDAEWRDTVSLVSENGRTVTLGDKVITKRLVAGGTVSCSASFIVPAIAEGTWYPKVNVNSYRDVFEGALGENNALTGDAAINVSTTPLDLSIANNGIINANSPTVLKLAFDATNDNRMVKFDVPSGVTATWGFGFMPGGTRSGASGSMTASGDGVMFRVPDGATDVYVILESDTTTTYNLSTESTQMTITSVTPATLPSSGTTTLTITGAGFGETNAVILAAATDSCRAQSIAKDASGNLIATVDCAALTAGQTYALRVESGDNAADLPSAVTVAKVEGRGHFWYELVLPESGRTGRASAGYVVYGNSGTANMVAPIVDLVSTGDGKISRYPNRDWSLQFRFLAVGGNSAPMVLSPGEEGRIDFYIMTQQRNEFSIYTSDGKQLHTGWPTQTAFEEAMAEAGSRLAWCGEDVSDYEKVFALAKHLRDGEYDNSIGGIVRGSAGEGVENAIVDLYQLSDDSTNKVQTVIASAVGRFVFNGLEDGRYIVGIAGKITEAVIVVADGLFVGNANLAVNTGRSITVTPDVLPASDDFVSITFTSCIDPSNVVFPIAIRQGNGYLFDAATDSGFYRVHCVVGNNEGFDGVYVSSNSDVEVSVSVTQPSSISGVVTDLSTYRLPDTDVILSFRGNLSGRTYTVIPDAETGAFEIGEMVGDSYVVTYSGLTCSYEPDEELAFDGGRDYQVTFSPLPADKTLTVSYPTSYNNHMLVVAGSEGVLTAEVLDGSGHVEISRVKNGVWSFVVVEESGSQVAAASLELTDENRSCQIVGANMSATMPLMASASRTASARPRLKGIGGWLADKFKALTHWLGEALANLLPISIMDFFETKEWKEGMDISNQARSYFMSHCKINYPGPCCCGYNDQKYPRDRAAVEAFCKQLNEFSTYVQTCSSMKVVASTSKSIADIADNIGEQVISSYTGGLLNKMVQINNIRVRFIALAAYVKAAKDLGADYEQIQKDLKDMTDAWDAVVFTLQHGGSWLEFESRITRLTEYISQWTFYKKRNYYSRSNKVFAEKLEEFGKVLKDIAIVIDAVRDIYQTAKEIDQMRHAVDQFPSRKAQFLQQYAYFQLVADNFGHYHEGKECQPEKWPDPEYEPPFDGPYPYPRVVQSYDPNEMVGPLGVGDPKTERFVKPGEWMTYTIYFENKTNATAAAQEVYVTNPLSEWLDWSTFKMHEVAFGDQIDLGLVDKSSGTSEVTMKGTNFVVRTELVLEENGDAGTRDACPYQAKWYMRIVDPTTDTGWPTDIVAGFLPPNDETHRGEGHITYSICVRADAPANLVISNSADIVFDHNPSITTDPAWWNTVGQVAKVMVNGDDVEGDVTDLDLIVGVPYGELPTPKARAGYAFDGWYTGPNGTGRRVTSESVVQAGDGGIYAYWIACDYAVTFDANGGEGGWSREMEYGTEIIAPTVTREGYTFAGWQPALLETVPASNVTFTAQWELITPEPEPDPNPTSEPTVEPTPAPVAAEAPRLWTEVTGAAPTVVALYEGYLCDGAGNVKGTIQVKVGKPGKKDGLAAVSAVVVGLDGKKTKLKATGNGKAKIEGGGPTSVSFAGGDACTVTLGAKGMGGTYGAYVIDGSLNVFASKDAADKTLAAATLEKWNGAVNVAWRLAGDGSPYQTLSVSIAAKGKAKVAGTLADGTKVSASGQLIVGENWCCVPVVCAKKGVSLQFAVWLPAATSAAAPVVVGLGDALVGKPGTLKGGAAFRIDAVALEAVLGKALLPYLPDGLAVTGGAKWTLPKAGSVTYAKGTTTVDVAKAGENPSGLKLTYKAKDGTFKGSFKAYADVGGKPKPTTVNVTGVLVGGVGYGAATVKNVGGVGMRVE